jgi:hypothetical protein
MHFHDQPAPSADLITPLTLVAGCGHLVPGHFPDQEVLAPERQGRPKNRFIARGLVGPNEGDNARARRFTYLVRVSTDWYQWDGAHKATFFDSFDDAMRAAGLCMGPWFNRPDPGTVEAVLVKTDP